LIYAIGFGFNIQNRKHCIVNIEIKSCKLYLASILITLVSINPVFAQDRITLNGIVKDKRSGETIIGATVVLNQTVNIGTVTNEYGFYSLTVPKGIYKMTVSLVGYQPLVLTKDLQKNEVFDVSIGEAASELKEITIVGEDKQDKNSQALPGVEKMDMKEMSKVPVIFGERDLLKTIQLLPGIKSAGEGNSGFYVRGGGADQNLILLDEAPVYNASHLLGFFSTFNSDAIKDVTVFKGNMPAQYGGRLSSVLDIKMNDGNDQSYHVSGGIGLISSKLNIEGPIKKGKGSFLITGRRTYADVFLKLSPNKDIRENTLYFYDLNLKSNYTLNSKNRLYLSGYFGRDKLGFGEGFGIDWGNGTGTLRWNSIISNKLFSNTSLIYSNYSYKISINGATSQFDVTSKIRDFNLKQEFQYYVNPKNTVRFGFNVIHHTMTPGQIEASEGSAILDSKLQERFALDNAVYVSNDWQASSKLKVNYGLRLSSFDVLGGNDYYTFDAEGNVDDTLSYKDGSIVKSYVYLEPRVSMSYAFNESSSIKAALARNVQNLHLISNSSTSTPTDIWIPSSRIVQPEISDQVSLGYYKQFKDKMYEFSAEIYYKDMQNIVDYKDGANTQANDLIEGELLFGQGRAYGLELFIKKKLGKFNGWIGYTLSRSERQIDNINNSEWYNARQDRTHDVSIVGIYDLNKKWSFSATFVFYTGNAATFPSGKYEVDGNVQFVYTERNGYRLPAYHRLDLGATLQGRKTDKFESSWNFSCYNAYGRENAFSIEFRESESDPQKTEAVQTTLFRWVPSVTYNFKF
jgi:hypothetical protein